MVSRTVIVALITFAALTSTTVGVEATSIGFDQTYYFHDATLLPSSVGANNAIRIQITSVIDPFDLLVSATALTQEEFANRAGTFAGFNCLGYLSDLRCIEYNVTPTMPGLFTGPIFITIAWLLNTNPISMHPLIIQAEGSNPYSSALRDQVYFPNSTGGIPFCPPHGDGDRDGNDDCDDPAETGTTDNFSRFAIAYNPVPEPGTLALVGAGAVAMAYRWRRRRSVR